MVKLELTLQQYCDLVDLCCIGLNESESLVRNEEDPASREELAAGTRDFDALLTAIGEQAYPQIPHDEDE